MTDTLSEAKKRFTLAWDYEQNNYEAAADDLKFAVGEQWTDDVVNERRTDNRPMLTINMMPQFIRQVTGDLRQNRPAIKVYPADTQASRDVADIYTEMIRGIEYESDAQTAYMTAADGSVTSGWGAFRIDTEYVSETSFEQKICIKRIPDALGVYFDPDAQELTREDAKWCFYVKKMTWEAFHETYPEAAYSSWDDVRLLSDVANWATVNDINVAEYWVKEPITRTMVLMPDGQTVERTEENAAIIDEGVELGYVQTRKMKGHKVRWYLMTAAEILEEGDWVGSDFPIIPVVGEERTVGARTIRHGLVRFAKDPQRLLNYHQSTMAEVTALAPKAPFIGTTEQFAGLEDEWLLANRRNMPYLRYNPDPAAPPPSRSSPSVDISTHMALTELANNNMYGTTGIYPTSLGARSNESSGLAIAQRQRSANVGTFVYSDNLAKAIAYCGRQLVDLIPKVYDTERIVVTMAEDGEENIRKINDGIVNMNRGTYAVRVETGPSFTTKRQEAAQSMLQMMQAMPQTASLVVDLFAKYQDWPGASQIADRLQRALPPGIDPKVDQKRMEEQGPPKPDPMQQIAQALAMAELKNKEATAQKTIAQAENERRQVFVTEREIGKINAETGRTSAETTGMQLANAEQALALAMQSGQLQEVISRIAQGAAEAAVRQQLEAMMLSRQAPPMVPGM
jgi:hypothetical protein